MNTIEPLVMRPLCTNSVDYVTVVSVGANDVPQYEKEPTDYVTVLKIGNEEPSRDSITEDVLVYRLPGEKLGFGLKFEGGTKSAEFVKRLFIQSCAVNSPASRVQSSWGPLIEGDEVLEIDSVPVNTMTRIDCVRCLKDSNVVIKLLIRHQFDEPFSKPTEDLPLVVSAEKKRTPPPPPPVPPRKVNRKSKENAIVIPPKGFGDVSEVPVPLARQNLNENRMKKSPYNSFRKSKQSPEVTKRDRKMSDDENCPPDAEVYIDLFSKEAAYSLSESDDTGSSISTVVDRLGSYPTTTTSSFSGSLPSTPTPVQKHIDVSGDIDFSNEDYLFSKLVTSQSEEDIEEHLEKDVFPKNVETNSPLQPPANFQDAPLSYGNEDVNIMKALENEYDDPPSPPPRSRISEKKKNVEEDEIITVELPRLVDFVPKSSPVREITNSIEIVKHFLEKEKINDCVIIDDNDNHIDNLWCEDTEFYSLDWSPSFKLATIGEDEEEVAQDECVSANIENPVVIIENADTCPSDESAGKCANSDKYDFNSNKENDLESSMESRQPPDGHEFPDYQEGASEEMPIIQYVSDKAPLVKPREIWKSKFQPPKNSVRDKIAIFSNQPPSIAKKYVSTDNITLIDSDNISTNLEKHKNISKSELSLEIRNEPKVHRVSTNLVPCNGVRTQSTLDLSNPKEESIFPRLSTRSLSLTDVSGKQDKLSQMMEQRRKCLSRLKGLVIPEHIPENENNVQPFIDLPEIKSDVNLSIFSAPKVEPNKVKRPHSVDMKFNVSNFLPQTSPHLDERVSLQRHSSYSCPTPSTRPSQTPILLTPTPLSPVSQIPTAPATNTQTQSSAIKRLQKLKSSVSVDNSPVDNHISHFTEDEKALIKVHDFTKLTVNVNQNDAPKSLESITSPTRSDYSFEYIYSPDLKTKTSNGFTEKVLPKIGNHLLEDESDNDSALSSSQSSYISKHSPPASPTNMSHTILDKKTDPSGNYDSLNRRLLKPQSVEAINRQNILASARCRSGRDLKVGSPLIQRKFDDDDNHDEPPPEPPVVPVERNVREKVVSEMKEEVHEDVKEEVFVKNVAVLDKKEEAFIKNEEAFVKNEEAFVTKEEVVVKIEEAFAKKEEEGEAFVKKEESFDKKEEVFAMKEEVFVKKDEGLIKKEKTSVKIENAAIKKEEVVRRKDVFIKGQESVVTKVEKSNVMKWTNNRSALNTETTLKFEVKETPKSTVPKKIKTEVPKSLPFTKAASVNDLRKNFEKETPTPSPRNSISICTNISPTEPKPTRRISVSQLQVVNNTFRKAEVPQQDIENVRSSIREEYGDTIPEEDLKVVILKPDVSGGSIGITLAGGADYETKEITIHKVRTGSPAYRDERLQKGDRILFINGKSMKGLSHSQSLKILKENVPEVIIAACTMKESSLPSPSVVSPRRSLDCTPVAKEVEAETKSSNEVIQVNIIKDVAGLGFSIQGGHDSLQGDLPLVIKKLFVGGAAEKSQKLQVGDELLEINGIDVTSLSRIDTWNLMKKLSDGEVILRVRR